MKRLDIWVRTETREIKSCWTLSFVVSYRFYCSCLRLVSKHLPMHKIGKKNKALQMIILSQSQRWKRFNPGKRNFLMIHIKNHESIFCFKLILNRLLFWNLLFDNTAMKLSSKYEIAFCTLIFLKIDLGLFCFRIWEIQKLNNTWWLIVTEV